MHLFRDYFWHTSFYDEGAPQLKPVQKEMIHRKVNPGNVNRFFGPISIF
jgi:hypothetical protein